MGCSKNENNLRGKKINLDYIFILQINLKLVAVSVVSFKIIIGN